MSALTGETIKPDPDDGVNKTETGEKDMVAAACSIRYVDHFSLGTPSTTVRFRGAGVHIYGDSADDQFLVEDRVNGAASSLLMGERQDGAQTLPGQSGQGRQQHPSRQHVLTVKRVQSTSASFGLQALRASYTLVALLVFGFLLVFAFQLVLFLVFNMLVNGLEKDQFAVTGVLLSVPIFLYSIANVMCLGWAFVVETWTGHPLCRHLFRIPLAASEWLCFAVFLGLPSVTMIVTLFGGNNHWWEATAGIWVAGVAAFGAAFAIAMVLYEANVCSRLIRLHYCTIHLNNRVVEELVSALPCWKRVTRLLLHSVHLGQLYMFSGVRRERYLVDGSDEPPKAGYSSNGNYSPVERRMSLYVHITERAKCCRVFYEPLSPPRRVYSMMEVRDVAPFVTKNNWSLENSFFMNRSEAQMITVTGSQRRGGSGGGVEPIQVKSTLACQFLGLVLIVALMAALMMWMRMGPKLVMLFSAMSIVFCILPILNSSRIVVERLLGHRHHHHSVQAADDGDGTTKDDEETALLDSATGTTYSSNTSRRVMLSSAAVGSDSTTTAEANGTLLQVWEAVRVTRPRIWLCYALFAAELVFLWLWPAISLFKHGNTPAGVTFVLLGCFAFLKLHFSIESILTELGPLQDIYVPRGLRLDRSRLREDEDMGDKGEREEESCRILHEKARISDVLGRVGRGRTVVRWIWAYGFTVALFFFVAYMAATSEYDTEDYRVKGVTFVPGFYYPDRNESNGADGNVGYPTCHLTKGFTFQGGEQMVRMEDYAFFATMSYAGPDEAKGLLDTWFGPGQVKDEYEFVDKYRTATSSWGGASYKLFSFPNHPGYGVVSIRGSEMTLDWLTNVELWSAASLLQTLRNVMPLGRIWTPILHKVAYMADLFKSASLHQVDYYRRTTQFVNDVLASQKYDTLRVTGVSLGGGLAIITGAQTGASTVAISGPNAMISRKTFTPPLTEDQLNTRVFNIIPDRDYIARIDDPGRLYSRISCRAPAYSLFGCHSMWRSLCEFQYQCGSENRPINCWCVSKYGYPPPVQNGTVAWLDACAKA